jgi:hypothetical protein
VTVPYREELAQGVEETDKVALREMVGEALLQ